MILNLKYLKNNPFLNNEHLLTKTAFLIGNGISRKNFDLNRLVPYGTIIGCNALYREFTPDILVAVDSSMMNEIVSSGYKGLKCSPLNTVNGFRQLHFSGVTGSGVLALKIIAFMMKPKVCYMLGMDGYHGNIYDGSKNYPYDKKRDFKKITKDYIGPLRQFTKFINVNEKDAWPSIAHETGNYEVISYTEFEEKLKCLQPK